MEPMYPQYDSPWTELSASIDPSMLGESPGITALSFDPYRELLWTGYESGRLTSTFFPGAGGRDLQEERVLQAYQQRDGYCSKYSSFRSFSGETVLEIIPLEQRVLSISKNMVRCHTPGGIAISSFNPLDSFVGSDLAGGNVINCGATFQPSGGLMRNMDQNYLFLGTTCKEGRAIPCPVFDLHHLESGPVLSFDTDGVSTRCVQSSKTSFLSLGGSDGKIRLVDPSLRSAAVQHTFEAHSGYVSSLSTTDDGTTLLSCGSVGRRINPYDPNSPVSYYPDPLIRVFDMRMLRPALPLSTTLRGTLSVARFMSSDENNTPTLLAASSGGNIQTMTLNPDSLEQDMSILPTVLCSSLLGTPSPRNVGSDNTSDRVSCLAVSASGKVIATGSTMGTLSVHAYCNEHNGYSVKVNENSDILSVPPISPSRSNFPDPSALNNCSVGSAFLLRKSIVTPIEATRLLSSFHSTPKIASKALRIGNSRKVSPSTLALASFQDGHFLGSIKCADILNKQSERTGKPVMHLPPNSFLCSKAKGIGYAVSDPRVVTRNQRAAREASASAVSPHLSPTITLSLSHSPSDNVSLLPPSNSDGHEVFDSQLNKQYHPPTAYRKMKSHRGKSRMQAFNYRAYNVLFSIPKIRDAALRTQVSEYHHSVNPTSLFGELGFLYDMMLSIASSASTWKDVSNVATATNFQRMFQRLPEANATGLFELDAKRTPHSPSQGKQNVAQAVSLVQKNVQVFARFLLHIINKEIEEEERHAHKREGEFTSTKPLSEDATATNLVAKEKSVVGSTFGHELNTTTTFLVSKTTVCSGSGSTTADSSSFVLDIAYPMDFRHSDRDLAPPFAAVLWSSCSQTKQQRGGWCSSSESYEPFRQTKSLNWSSISDFLVLLCGQTFEKQSSSKEGWSRHSLWQKRNHEGMPWLPTEVECLFVPEADCSPGEGAHGGRLIISELQLREEDATKWLIYDGKELVHSSQPASSHFNITEEHSIVKRLKLFAVISGVVSDLSDEVQAHPVLHLRTSAGKTGSEDNWALFNDFAVMNCSAVDATSFLEWRFPCVLFFANVCPEAAEVPVPHWPLAEDGASHSLEASMALFCSGGKKIVVPESVLQLPSVSSTPSVPAKTFTQMAERLKDLDEESDIDKSSDVVIAFDAEFVSVSVDEIQLDSRGERVVKDEARQVLARISLLDGLSSRGGDTSGEEKIVVLSDDHVLPTESVVDYVTRFSGLVAEDLDPTRSRHAVVQPRTAYLKLRYYLDAGCIFVGHGLQKDFETANIFVPPERVRDTVELWRLPHQRKISLRFLAYYILKMEIQDDLHDSIEDAWTALLLYRRYQELMKKGYNHFHGKLTELYAFGSKTNWTIGLDRLSKTPSSPPTGPMSTDHNMSDKRAGHHSSYPF